MMVVSRKTGELIYADPLTEEQRKAAALAVFKAFLQNEPGDHSPGGGKSTQ